MASEEGLERFWGPRGRHVGQELVTEEDKEEEEEEEEEEQEKQEAQDLDTNTNTKYMLPLL